MAMLKEDMVPRSAATMWMIIDYLRNMEGMVDTYLIEMTMMKGESLSPPAKHRHRLFEKHKISCSQGLRFLLQWCHCRHFTL